MIDRREKKPIRAYVLGLSDAALQYLREEADREHKRRRLAARERRAAKRAKVFEIVYWDSA